MVCLESHTRLEHRWANAIFPYVTYLLSSSRINKAIDAIVDTGSPFTVLSGSWDETADSYHAEEPNSEAGRFSFLQASNHQCD